MAVLTGMVAGAMVFSSFAASKQEKELECVQLAQAIPSYWDGVAYDCAGHNPTPIKVYQTEGQCNSFYAVVQSGNYKGEQCWVKNNPRYDSEHPTWNGREKYYITCGNTNLYFNM